MLLDFAALIGLCLCLVAYSRTALAASSFCPLLGPVLPAPRSVSGHSLARSTAESLARTINSLTSSANSTSFSVSLTSIHEDSPLFEIHRTANALNTTGIKRVDADSIYRIGSITKLITVFTLLVQDKEFDWTDPVTKYVPELAAFAKRQANSSDEVSVVQWDEVTIEALASQLAGIGRNYGFADLSAFPVEFPELGLPTLKRSDIPPCGDRGSLRPCSREDFFAVFPGLDPVYAPYTTPIYSNAAYVILGSVIEAITGQSYEEAVQALIFKPLAMDRSSITTPSQTSSGVIPIGSEDWERDIGYAAPAGAAYSSTRDLTKLGKAILSNTLLSPARTRRWMKPKTHTASLRNSVGAPWEIYRSDKATQDGRVIDYYTKNGALGLYFSILVLIPDYDLVLTVLAAGTEVQTNLLADLVLSKFLPVVEKIGKDEAAAAYAGTYALGNSSLTLAVDDGPGLKITNWFSNGIDLLRTDFSRVGGINAATSSGITVKLYSTNLESDNPKKRSFRYVIDASGADAPSGAANSTSSVAAATASPSSTARSAASSVPNILRDPCGAWGAVGGAVYGSEALDEVIFRFDQGSDVASVVELPGWRAVLKRIGSAAGS